MFYRNYNNNNIYFIPTYQISTTIRRALLKHYKAQTNKKIGKMIININLSK